MKPERTPATSQQGWRLRSPIVVFAMAGLLSLMAWGTLVARGLERQRAQTAVRPMQKIILMTIDALRADRLGCYGYQGADTSPTIDAWAKQALLFEHTYSQAPWTVPSLASLMSGRYPREVGAHTNLLGDIYSDEATLPEQLHNAGYQTAFFNTNPLLSPRAGLDRGFDSIGPPQIGKKIPYAAMEPQVMEWLDKNAQHKFFLWIHDMDTHSPVTPGNPYRGTPGWNDYDAEVRAVDDAVRHLFAKLDALGIRDEVLFVFTADHGESFGEHHLSGHQDVIYDEVLHIPLIIQYPAMVRTGRVSAPVALLDVNPTIATLAGLPETAVRRGESLAPLTNTTTATVRHPYVFSSRYYFGFDRIDPATGTRLIARGTHHLAVRNQRWKLIAKVQASVIPPLNDQGVEGDTAEQPDWTVTQAHYELYDLTTDPLEQHDVFVAQPKEAGELQRALAAWKRMTDGGYQAKKVTPITVDPPTREMLHALGYG